MKEATVQKSKITLRDVWTVFWRWQLSCEMSNSYERMQSVAYCFAMVPVLKKLYPDRAEFIEALQRHLVFFNTEGTIGSIILGMTVALEEEKAVSGGAVTGESIIAMKSALMGPVAGIGDTISQGTVKAIIFTLAVTASAGGSVVGWFLLFAYALISGTYSWALMVAGYRMGKNALGRLIASGWIDRIISGASMLGLFVVGGLSATNVSLNLTATYVSNGVENTVQGLLDSIVPGLLPLCLVMGLSYYFKMKQGTQKFGIVVLVLMAAALIAAYYLLIFRTPSASAAEETWKLAGLLLCVLAAGKFLFGWVNGNNYARNSASIVIALTCLDRFPAGQVAVALLDHSCCGFQGYQQLYRRLERKGLRKNLLVLDCVTSGEELHLHGLGELPELTGVQNHQLTAPECKGSVLELFPGGQILTGGQEAGGETVILDTRCGRDRQIRLDKMERTVEIIRQLVQLRGGAVEKSDFGSKEEKSK